MAANLQLYVSTGEKNYLERFTQEIWQSLEGNVNYNIILLWSYSLYGCFI